MSSNINYFLTIDSNFRDREKFPLETDFAISFQTKDSKLQYPKGQPLIPSQFFPRITIDKNFDHSKLKVLNGQITSIAYHEQTEETLYAGYSKNYFTVHYDDSVVFQESPVTAQDDEKCNDHQLPFLFKLSRSNTLIWVILAKPHSSQSHDQPNKINNVDVQITNNSNYLLSFDYTSNISFYKYFYTRNIRPSSQNNTSKPSNLLNVHDLNYNIINPYGNGLSSYVVTSFNANGQQALNNNTPWGYHNFYTSSPFNVLPSTSLSKNCIITDKANNIYAGVNVDNITPSHSTIVLDIEGHSNSPIYYPSFIGVSPWKTLTLTEPQIFSPSSYSKDYKLISQSVVLCNTVSDLYKGTSVLFPNLIEKIESEDDQSLYVSPHRKFELSKINDSNDLFFKTNIDQITTASIYKVSDTDGLVISDSTSFEQNVSSLNVITFNYISPGKVDVKHENNHKLRKGDCQYLNILCIDTIYKIEDGKTAYVLVLYSTDVNLVNTTLELLEYDTVSSSFKVVTSINQTTSRKFCGIYFDGKSSTYVVWSSGEYGNITFYAVLHRIFNKVYTIKDIEDGKRTDFKTFYLDNSYHFNFSINMTQYSYNLSFVTLITLKREEKNFFSSDDETVIAPISSQTTSSYSYLDSLTKKHYFVSSNPELSIYNIYNTSRGYQVGQNNNISNFNIVHYVSKDGGDIYATGKNPNTLSASWGSLLQSPTFISSHVYENRKSKFYFPNLITNSCTFELNDRLYAVYAYDEPVTFPVYLYVYDITDINNPILIGTVSTDSSVLPIVRLNVNTLDNNVFILCESVVTKVVVFKINRIDEYKVLDIDVTGSNMKYSNLLKIKGKQTNVMSQKDELHLYQASSSNNGFIVKRFLYDEWSRKFNVVKSKNIECNSSITIFNICDIYFTFDNVYQIVLVGTNGEMFSPYQIYFIDFNTMIETNRVSTSLKSVGSENLFTLVSQLNEIDKTNQISFNCTCSETNTQFIASFIVPNLVCNVSDTVELGSHITLPHVLKEGLFATVWNRASNQMLLICENETTFDIYDTTVSTSFTKVSIIDKVILDGTNIFKDIDILTVVTFNSMCYLIVNANNDYHYITKIIDITNPLFAELYQTPAKVETSRPLYGKGVCSISKINFQGQTEWINCLGDSCPRKEDEYDSDPSHEEEEDSDSSHEEDSVREDCEALQEDDVDSQSVNISGICLNESELELCVSCTWKSKIASTEYKKNCESTLLLNPFSNYISYNSCIFTCSTDYGVANYSLPLIGTLQSLVTNPVRVKNNYCVAINYKGSNLNIYKPQRSIWRDEREKGGLYMLIPSVIQKSLSNLSNQTSCILSVDEKCDLKWTSLLKSDSTNSFVDTCSISSSNNILNILSSSFQSDVSIISSDDEVIQKVYPFEETSKSNYIINTRFNCEGKYIESNSFETFDVTELKPVTSVCIPSENIVIHCISVFTNHDSSIIYRNKDGTLASVSFILASEEKQSVVAVYRDNSDFIDTNFKSYSSLTVYKNSEYVDDIFTPYDSTIKDSSLINYCTYLLGESLNSSFLIRNNFYKNDSNVIVLDQKIDVTKLVRKFIKINSDANSSYFHSGNISKTSIMSVVEYVDVKHDKKGDGDSSCTIKVLHDDDFELNSFKKDKTSPGHNRYYVLHPLGDEIGVSAVEEVSSTGVYTYIKLSGDKVVNDDGFVYLTAINSSALHAISFKPVAMYKTSSYYVSLQKLTLPNRPIKTNKLNGVRYLSDYPYIFLQVLNSNDDSQIDASPVNNTHTNNPNLCMSNPSSTRNMFTIDINIQSSPESNFVFLSTNTVQRITFTPGYNNLHLKLLDPDGNIISFDNTSVKENDKVFNSGVVDQSLIRMVVQLVFSNGV